MSNTLFLVTSGRELSENAFFNFGTLSVVEETSADNRRPLCAEPKRFTVHSTAPVGEVDVRGGPSPVAASDLTRLHLGCDDRGAPGEDSGWDDTDPNCAAVDVRHPGEESESSATPHLHP